MPILWRYALQSYLRVFSLSVCTFISVLIVARFKEIARFTALSGDWLKTGLFIVYQVPSILPIAIPLSALLASLLLFQRLSRTYELTALRASGIPLRTILAPLLLCSIFLSLFNFSICAQIAPFCRREGKTLIYHETTQNPLLLLQRQKLVKIKHAYLNMKVKDEETTKDLVLIVHNDSNQRLNLLLAKKLRMIGEELLGGDLTIVSYLNADSGFDSLIIENQSSMSTSAPLLSTALKRNRPRLDVNALDLKMLRIKAQENSKKAKPARVEILRRISLSMAAFSFTLLGCAFGIEEGRNPSRKNLFAALFLTLTVLVSYLLGKGLKEHVFLGTLAFLIPHPFIWLCSIFRLHRIAKGRA
jgi:lipopolysaccharide export system permease protein